MRPVDRRGSTARMVNVDLVSVLAVFTAMTVAAALPALFPRLGVPGVVLEIAGGVLTMLVYPTLGLHRLTR